MPGEQLGSAQRGGLSADCRAILENQAVVGMKSV